MVVNWLYEEDWNYYPGTNLAQSGSGDVIGGRVYGFDYRGNRTREREYGSSAQAANLGADWTRSRVAGFNSDGLLECYTVYSKSSTGGLDTSLYAYGRDVLGKKNFGATGKRDASGDTSWSVNRRYTWDGDWVVTDSTEVGRRFYAYLGHRRIAEVAEDTAGKWTSRAVLTDHLGTVTGVVGDSGKVEATYQLDPYGNLEKYAGMYQTLYLYTGKEWVSELAGYEFGARVYDPVMGMWWGRDPVLQYWTPYGYTSIPLNSIDPDGFSAFIDNSGEVLFTADDGYNDVSVLWNNDGREIWVPIGSSQEPLDVGNTVFLNYQNSEEYQSQLNLATTNKSGYSNWIWAGAQSLPNGYMDFRGSANSLPDEYSHFMLNGTVYERAKAGNYMWGRSMALLGFSMATTRLSAEVNAFANAKKQNPMEFGLEINMLNRWTLPVFAHDGTFGSDNPFDRQAIRNGYYAR